MQVYLVYENNGVEGYAHRHVFSTKELAEEYIRYQDGHNWLQIEEMDVVDYSFTKFYLIEVNVRAQYFKPDRLAWSETNLDTDPHYNIGFNLHEYAVTSLEQNMFDGAMISVIPRFENSPYIKISRKTPISQLERQKFNNFATELNDSIGLIPRDKIYDKIKELTDSIKQKFEEIFIDG